jgi:hypothetical protein
MMREKLSQVVDLEWYPLDDERFRSTYRASLEADGRLVLPAFLTAAALESVRDEARAKRDLAYFCPQKHNVYLTPPDPDFPADHVRNREVVSSKGCITDDQVAADSSLRILYDSPLFREFLCKVLNEQALYEYADPLSSINIHYASAGQELGWHFDNSSFATTLMIEEPEGGGHFEFIRSIRNADHGEMNFDAVADVLDGNRTPDTLNMRSGTLVLFRGRDAIHRVTPVTGDKTRVLVVLAYNSEPGIALSESARMTFYGRLQ